MFDSLKKLPQTSIKKQLVDQTAHIAAGAALSGLALLGGLTAAPAIAISVGFEIVREYFQHDRSFKFGVGSIVDIGFWALGASLPIIL